jgi:VCBS repeat protein
LHSVIIPDHGLFAPEPFGRPSTRNCNVRVSAVSGFKHRNFSLEGFADKVAPTNHLYRNDGGGEFIDVTSEAGMGRSGWGNGVCVGDFDNDGFDFVCACSL